MLINALFRPKSNDLGIIDVSRGKPSVHTLADGRACTITPTLLPNCNVHITTTVEGTSDSMKTQMKLEFEAPADQGACTYALGKGTVITVAFSGYPKHTAGIAKKSDLGVTDVSSVKPTNHTLADGRACTVTPTLLPNGNASLAIKIDGDNGLGGTKLFQAPVDGRAIHLWLGQWHRYYRGLTEVTTSSVFHPNKQALGLCQQRA